jgi:hypothetical protein
VWSMPYPSHPLCFDHLNNIWWRAQTTKCLINFLQSFVTSSLLCPNILLSTLFLSTLNINSSLFHTHRTQQVKL